MLIQNKVNEYAQWIDSHKAAELIANLLDEADGIRAKALEKSLKMLHAGKSPEEALIQLATSLTGKLVHPTLEMLKQAAAQGNFELLKTVLHRLDGDKSDPPK